MPKKLAKEPCASVDLSRSKEKSPSKSTHTPASNGKVAVRNPASLQALHPLLEILLKATKKKDPQQFKEFQQAQIQALNGLDPSYPVALTRLRTHLIDKKLASPEAVQSATAQLLGLEFQPHPKATIAPADFISDISIQYAKKFMFCPLAEKNGCLIIAAEDASHANAMEDAAFRLGKSMSLVLSTRQAILGLINRAYEKSRGEEKSSDLMEGIEIDASSDWSLEEPEDLIDARDEEPIKRLLNSLLYQASQRNASDVHLDSNQDEVKVRFRIDGILYNIADFPKAIQRSLINRVKIISRLDIAQRGSPQDGRTLVLVAGRRIDIRVSIMPTIQGEKAVMRLLYQDQQLMNLFSLGMPKELSNPLARAARKSGGITLISGPTGSGKTTSLYALLNTLNRERKNIATIEDPVEYKLPGYSQTEINPKAGLTFASALRSMLRQDPDVIMVGEMRDRETVIIATQAALTGHSVFSTIHTNNAPATITRLIDMGVEPYLVTSTVNAVMAQRLVRRLCQHCKEKDPQGEKMLLELGLSSQKAKTITTWHAKGCQKCEQLGYHGRLGVFELLVLDENLKKTILTENSSNAIRKTAEKSGMKSMFSWGLDMVQAGSTTPEELLNINQDS